MIKLAFLVVLTLTVLTPFGWADTLHVTDDAFVNAPQPSANFGANQSLLVSRTRTAFLRFDIQPLVDGPASDATRLRLFLNSVQAPGVITFHAVLDSWSEATITAGTAPAVEPVPFASAALASSQVGDYLMIDASPVVQAWLDGVLTNHGVAIRANLTDNTSVTFDAKENRQTSHAPELEALPGSGDVQPIGAVLLFAGSAPPNGWVFCDGSELPRTLALFDVVGTVFGNGDGVTTFNLPDLRSRLPIGAGTGSGLSPRQLADMGGEEQHTLTVAEIPPHTHSYQQAYKESTYEGDDSPHQNGLQGAETGATGGGQPHNTMPPFLALNFIIKAE
jgi:microcystin-dependent protein